MFVQKVCYCFPPTNKSKTKKKQTYLHYIIFIKEHNMYILLNLAAVFIGKKCDLKYFEFVFGIVVAKGFSI